MRMTLLSMAIGLLIANAVAAGESCAAPAGCDDACRSKCCDRCGGGNVVCKLVCETQKAKRHVWVVECEYFCPTLPGCGRPCQPCCKPVCDQQRGCCQPACDGCGKQSCGDPCAAVCKPLVPPKCGKARCRKKLVKKEITCEVPVYKCVAVCCDCGQSCGGCDPGCCQQPYGADAVEEETPEAPIAAEATTQVAPLPPVIGTSYLKHLKIRP